LIIGTGVDLVSIDRIEKIYLKYPDKFLSRIFSDLEKENFTRIGSPISSLAARFAAKEAVLKAIGCGIGPAAFIEVEIIALPGQQPRVKLYGEALRFAGDKKIKNIALSISHEPPFACAFAIAFR